VLYPRWINLFFLHGVALADPTGLMQGTGKVVRHVRIEELSQLEEPAMRALIAEAVRESDPPIDESAPRRIVIKMIAEKQRPRRPLDSKPKKLRVLRG
jgi:hypothetical protein